MIPLINTLSTSVLSSGAPRGLTIPFMINTAKHIRSTGVKKAPIISTTFEGLIVNTRTITKNIIAKTIGLRLCPKLGTIPIS